MKRELFYLIIGLFLSLNSVASCYSEDQYIDTINDGPYIFNVKNKLKIKWVRNNVLKEDHINPENFAEIKNKFNLLFSYNDLMNSYSLKSNYSQYYDNIDSISVISDIHGKYDNYINLLKVTGIIDNNLNWKFGKGHLVVLGDILDRGDMVTEVLWHLFGLEKQAAEAGGMVHVMLGNHELMVFSQDLRYLGEKYQKVELITDTKYFDLFSENSVLGHWLRSKPVMITINDILFVHGGISIELVRRNLTTAKINEIFSKNIVGKEMMVNNINEEQIFLAQDNGPVWYRGYFADTNFCESRLDSILNFYNKKHIVVGHTTFKDINSLFSNKIFGIDTGIGSDKPGKMLIYKDGFFYKGCIKGTRIKL